MTKQIRDQLMDFDGNLATPSERAAESGNTVRMAAGTGGTTNPPSPAGNGEPHGLREATATLLDLLESRGAIWSGLGKETRTDLEASIAVVRSAMESGR